MTKPEAINQIIELYLKAHGRPTASQTYEIRAQALWPLFDLVEYLRTNLPSDPDWNEPVGTD